MPRNHKNKYTRQGVEAAARLVECTDELVWSQTEAKYQEMLEAKGGTELVELDKYCEDLAHIMKERKSITKAELLKIVQWKFLKGKKRPALLNHLRANSDETVQQHTEAGIGFADDGDAKKAIAIIATLRGVGPATASAILSLYKPDMFAFMDDEVIECLYDGKRGYTAAIYHNVNDKCNDLARKVTGDWDPRKIGRTLWTAARISASGGNDCSEIKTENDTTSTGRPSKRRKKS
jgi:hypothetical protein